VHDAGAAVERQQPRRQGHAQLLLHAQQAGHELDVVELQRVRPEHLVPVVQDAGADAREQRAIGRRQRRAQRLLEAGEVGFVRGPGEQVLAAVAQELVERAREVSRLPRGAPARGRRLHFGHAACPGGGGW
jgi:hypothetical protein